MLFVDVRGSTTVAENLAPKEFTWLVHRFHSAATRILIRSDAMVEKLVGDQLTGLYVPGYAGPNYPRKALEAGLEIQERMTREVWESNGLPVGIGVHVGRAYIGPGELIVSDRCYQAAGIEVSTSDPVEMPVKGRQGVVPARTVAGY